MRSSRLYSASAALIAALFLATACASGSGGGITVSAAWARPTVGVDKPTGAYLTIANTSGQADALLSVSSPAASSVEIHETSTDQSGMTGMHPISRIDVAAGATVKLQPGGLHLMISGPTRSLQVGDRLELDLVFERAGTIVVSAEIREG